MMINENVPSYITIVLLNRNVSLHDTCRSYKMNSARWFLITTGWKVFIWMRLETSDFIEYWLYFWLVLLKKIIQEFVIKRETLEMWWEEVRRKINGGRPTCFCGRSKTASLKSAPSIIAPPRSLRVSTDLARTAFVRFASFNTCTKHQYNKPRKIYIV